MEIKQVHSSIEYKIGATIKKEDTGEIFKVITCVPLEWISGGEKSGFLVRLKQIG